MNIITIKIPMTVNHFDPCLFIYSVKSSPNLHDKYATIKNLRLLEIKLTIIKIGKLKKIKPLVIVKALYGRGVKPAKKRMLSQARNPFPCDILIFKFFTLFSYP